MTQATDPRIEKIRKLLEKADAKGATEAEAETYREKAYELMIKWEIDDAQLDADKSERLRVEEIVRRTVHLPVGMTYSYEFACAMAVVAEGMGLKAFIGKSYKNEKTGKHAGRSQLFSTVVLVGFRADADRAELLFDHLIIQLQTALTAFGKTLGSWYTASQKWNQRRSFIMGWGNEVGARYASLRKVATDATSGTGTDLVLVDKAALVDQWVNDNMTLGRGRSRHYRSSGMEAGMDAGARADIGQNRFGASARGAVGQ